jgi:hypothetical protein
MITRTIKSEPREADVNVVDVDEDKPAAGVGSLRVRSRACLVKKQLPAAAAPAAAAPIRPTVRLTRVSVAFGSM